MEEHYNIVKITGGFAFKTHKHNKPFNRVAASGIIGEP